MVRRIVLIVSLFISGILFLSAQQLIDYVNPMIGTGSMGHVYPGAVAPRGLVALSPETDTIPYEVNGVYQKNVYRYCAGYQYGDSTIVGFSHTHLSGTGHSDLGDILIMPETGKLRLTPGTKEHPESGYRSRFSHEKEHSSPGYYSVFLEDYDILAEMTATERTGVHRYTFQKSSGTKRIILDLVHGIYNYEDKVLWSGIRVESPTLLTGYRITNGWARENYIYFAIRLSKPILNYGYKNFVKVNYTGGWKQFDIYHNFPEMSGKKIRAYFEFGEIGSLELKVSLSPVSTKNAMENLDKETGNKSFDEITEETKNKWEKELNVIDAKGTEDQMSMLYTSLYHTLINPSVYEDVNGEYRGLDGNIHKAEGFTNYTIFSLWDTYRALHPLLNIIDRKRNRDMCYSMLIHREQSVHKILPVWSMMASENWCMIGYHAVSVLSDAVTKGIDISTDSVLDAMISSSTYKNYDNLGDYMKYGYVPFDKNSGGVSITLEYAYDDWCIYHAAMNSGDTVTARIYKKRALNYRNVINPGREMARARLSSGKWKMPYSLLKTDGEGFVEGNSWNYSFYAPHDVCGLINAMGGDNSFVGKLDSLFTMHMPDEFFANTEDVTAEGIIGAYVHGNEPSHHIVYLYNWTSAPWKAQYWIRKIMNTKYKNEINGLCGNDDCGQMSAWYLFSAMGFYPVCPGTDQLVLGAPYLPYIRLNLSGGNSFTVKAQGVNDKNRYVKSVKLNGKIYNKGYITNSDILNGGTLIFEMSSKPNKKRIFKGENMPYSLTR